jgi:hypothetical protein
MKELELRGHLDDLQDTGSAGPNLRELKNLVDLSVWAMIESDHAQPQATSSL